MNLVALALKSLWSRRVTMLLTGASIALSVTLLLGVQRIRTGARTSFENTLSGTDLIAGARTGPVQLLLYAIFRIGNGTNNVSWESYQHFAHLEDVAWSVPISLGDSHRGYRVVGTNADYFTHYQYGQHHQLDFSAGVPFGDLYDAVIGSDVADALGYSVGTKVILSHGVGEASFTEHENKPFVVSGILAHTGTPVDRSVHISLEAIEAIHADWQDGGPPLPGKEMSASELRQRALVPTTITAFLIGLQSKTAVFRVQRAINEYQEEPMLAVLPGSTFQELWRTVGMAETALMVITIFVVLTGLIGMLTAILTSLNERRREMAVLRSVGAHPRDIFFLLFSESAALAIGGCVTGTVLMYTLLGFGRGLIERRLGLNLPLEPLSATDAWLLGGVMVAGALTGVIPAIKAYRNSLADGLSIRL